MKDKDKDIIKELRQTYVGTINQANHFLIYSIGVVFLIMVLVEFSLWSNYRELQNIDKSTKLLNELICLNESTFGKLVDSIKSIDYLDDKREILTDLKKSINAIKTKHIGTSTVHLSALTEPLNGRIKKLNKEYEDEISELNLKFVKLSFYEKTKKNPNEYLKSKLKKIYTREIYITTVTRDTNTIWAVAMFNYKGEFVEKLIKDANNRLAVELNKKQHDEKNVKDLAVSNIGNTVIYNKLRSLRKAVAALKKAINLISEKSNDLEWLARQSQIKQNYDELKIKLEKELKNKEQSIPTPFGSFKMHSRVVLIVLTVVTLFIYIKYCFYVNRVFCIEKSLIVNGIKKNDLDSIIKTPFWYYPRRSIKQDLLIKTYLYRIYGAILFQIGFLLMYGSLIYEYFRWNSVFPLWFTSLLGVKIVLSLFSIIFVFLVLTRLFPKTRHFLKEIIRSDDKKSKSNVFLDRRAFLVYGVCSIAGYKIYNKLLNTKLIKHLLDFTDVKRYLRKNLVVNIKTNVVHHKRICSDHLPNIKNINFFDKSFRDAGIHKDFSSRILESIVDEPLDFKSAIFCLEKAIEINPHGLHLYDKLVRKLGSVKRYNEIHIILEEAHEKFLNQLHKMKPNTKNYRKIEWIAKELYTRRQGAQNRRNKHKS